jgi:hypothetical protein
MAPVMSMVINFLTLLALNILGIGVDLQVYGVVVTIAAGAMLLWDRGWLKCGRQIGINLAIGTVVLAVAFVVWRRAFSGFLWHASNQDGSFHNLWVRRMVDTGSILWSDFWVQSPLALTGGGTEGLAGFLASANYPQAWHASVAVASAITGAPVPLATWFSTLLLWSVGLTFGLIAITRIWARSKPYLGGLAAIVAQFSPQVPGVPMTWGTMPSVIGVALLPAGLAAFMQAGRSRTVASVGVAGIALFGAAIIHPPEAATLLVVGTTIVVMDSFARRRPIRGFIVAGIGGAFAIGGYLAVKVAKPDLFATLAEQKGRYELRQGLENALSMSVQTCDHALRPYTCHIDRGVIVFLVIGIAISLVSRANLALLAGLAMGIFIFLSAAAVNGTFLAFRPYTFPWYASYERTAWVLVPLISLFIAYPISQALWYRHRHRSVIGLLVVIIACAYGGYYIVREAPRTIQQLRAGPVENQLAYPGAPELFWRIKKSLKPGDIVLSPMSEGGVYAYSYEGVPVTNGFTEQEGKPSDVTYRVLTEPESICAKPELRSYMRAHQMAGILIGTQGTAWGGQVRTPELLDDVRGWRVADKGGELWYLVPDASTC